MTNVTPSITRSSFVNRMFNNVNKHFHDFLKIFPKLDLRYKT